MYTTEKYDNMLLDAMRRDEIALLTGIILAVVKQNRKTTNNKRGDHEHGI